MLDRARRRTHRLGTSVDLDVADIEALPYPDGSFDTVTAACVFCSVDDPVRGLREAARVVRPDGQVLLYEHVRPDNPVLGRLTDWVSPLTRRLFGPELNRPTEANIRAAGLHLAEVRRRGILREIVATPPPGG
jgi:ubiquinone/menaquinone biosynthesis C-methylase UbiE